MYERYRDGEAADDDADERVIQVYLYAFPFEADPT